MKDLIDFVKEPGATIHIGGIDYSLVMLEDDSLVFSTGDSTIELPESALRLSTYHGAGIWKVKRKHHGQIMNRYMFMVTINGQKAEIKNEQNQQLSRETLA